MILSMSLPDWVLRSAEGGNDAGGHRGLKPQRAADGHHQLANAQGLGAARRAGLNPEVSTRITARSESGSSPIKRLYGLTVQKGHLHFLRFADHMTVGENETVRGEKEPGTTARFCQGMAWVFLPRVFSIDVDVYDRRAHLLAGVNDSAGIGIQ